jgi:hypothetical protein
LGILMVDDLPRMHDNYGNGHDDRRRADDDFRMSSATVPAALGDQASGGGEQGESTRQKQNDFHIMSPGLCTPGGNFAMGYNPMSRKIEAGQGINRRGTNSAGCGEKKSFMFGRINTARWVKHPITSAGILWYGEV